MDIVRTEFYGNFTSISEKPAWIICLENMPHCLKGQLQGLRWKEDTLSNHICKNSYLRKRLRNARKKTALLNAGKIDFTKHESEFKGRFIIL